MGHHAARLPSHARLRSTSCVKAAASAMAGSGAAGASAAAAAAGYRLREGCSTAERRSQAHERRRRQQYVGG